MDTVEPTAEVIAGGWQTLAEQIEALQERSNTPAAGAVHPRSSLAADDRRLEPYNASHAAHILAGSAVDHLHALCALVSGQLHAYAPFTLVRAAIETAATGLWIVGPGDRQVRVLHTLQWTAADIIDSDLAVTGIHLPMPRTRSARLADLEALALKSGLASKDAVRRPRSTDIVRYAESLAVNSGNVLIAWRWCSGFAHGRRWPALAGLEREVFTNEEGEVLQIRLTSEPGRVLFGALIGLDLMKQLLVLYDKRAASPYD